MFAGGDIDESTPIILLVLPPELHLLLGPVNKMYSELIGIWPQGEEWSKKLYIKREQYHRGSFNGNDSRKLLKNVSLLKEIVPASNQKVQNYIAAFEAFNDVVTAWYTKNLAQDYQEIIKIFRVSYRKLKISITPKIHAVFHHISEFCVQVKMGLAPWSEQAAESLHHDFNHMRNNFKARDIEHADYGNRLLQAVMYNSQHM